jgi:hypothetical protein
MFMAVKRRWKQFRKNLLQRDGHLSRIIMREYFGQSEDAKYAVGSTTNIAVVLHADLQCIGMRLLSARDLDGLAKKASDVKGWSAMVRRILKFRLEEVLLRIRRRYLRQKSKGGPCHLGCVAGCCPWG